MIIFNSARIKSFDSRQTMIPEKENVPTIAVTSRGNNLLRRHADYTFSISSRERLYSKLSTFATEKSIQFILDILFSACFSLSYEKNPDMKIQTARLLEYGRNTTNRDIRETEETLLRL